MKKSIVFLLVMVLISACCFMALQSCGDADDNADKKDDAAEEPGKADEEIPTTAAPATPAPTTAEPTTEKPPPVLEEIARWTFSEEDKIFRTSSQTTDFRVEDGILKMTSTGGDPNIMTISANLEMDTAEIDYIKFKIKNNSDGFRTQLFFVTNEDTNWSEAQSMRSEYWNSEGEDWEILEFDTADCMVWEGTLKQLRFDYLEQEGDIEIEYVSFEKVVKQ